jgi:hypothetical protein
VSAKLLKLCGGLPSGLLAAVGSLDGQLRR